MHTITMLLTCPTYSPLAAIAFQSIVDIADTALFLAASVLSVYSGALSDFEITVPCGCIMYMHGIALLL